MATAGPLVRLPARSGRGEVLGGHGRSWCAAERRRVVAPDPPPAGPRQACAASPPDGGGALARFGAGRGSGAAAAAVPVGAVAAGRAARPPWPWGASGGASRRCALGGGRIWPGAGLQRACSLAWCLAPSPSLAALARAGAPPRVWRRRRLGLGLRPASASACQLLAGGGCRESAGGRFQWCSTGSAGPSSPSSSPPEELVFLAGAVRRPSLLHLGMRFSNLYCDPLIIPGGHKITARQRWQPTPMQLQILENIFDQGNGTPSKQRIKEITAELSHHGQISETNVYNWFQNRRARSKRKQAASVPNNAESEAEVDEESLTDKKPKSDRTLHDHKAMSAHNADRISGMHHFDADHDQIGGMMYGSNDNVLRSSGSSGSHMSFYDNIMSNPRIDHFLGKVESSRSFSHLQHGEGFDMFG